jgi:hypothetical protein
VLPTNHERDATIGQSDGTIRENDDEPRARTVIRVRPSSSLSKNSYSCSSLIQRSRIEY